MTISMWVKAAFATVVVTLAIVGFAGAAEAEGTLTVTPSTDLYPGQVVTIEAHSDPAFGSAALGLCRRDVDASDVFDLSARCFDLSLSLSGPIDSADAWTLPANFTGNGPLGGGQNVDCVAQGCDVVLIWGNLLGFSVVDHVRVPVSFVTPVVTVTPNADLRGGQLVQVDAVDIPSGHAGATAQLCQESLIGNSGVFDPATHCAAGDALVDDSGATAFSTPLTVERRPSIGGSPVDCSARSGDSTPCVIVVFGRQSADPGAPVTWRVEVDVAFAPVLQASPTTDLVDGTSIDVGVSPDGSPNGNAFFGQCLGGAEPTSIATAQDVCVGGVHPLAEGSATTTFAAARFLQLGTGDPIDCVAFGCDVVAVVEPDDAGAPATSYAQPLRWAQFTDFSGGAAAMVGDTVTVTSRGTPTVPGAAAFLMQCGGFLTELVCDNVGTTETDFDGEFDGEIVPQAVLTSSAGTLDCAVKVCAIGLLVLSPEMEGLFGALHRVVVSSPPLAVSPSENLADGQSVTIGVHAPPGFAEASLLQCNNFIPPIGGALFLPIGCKELTTWVFGAPPSDTGSHVLSRSFESLDGDLQTCAGGSCEIVFIWGSSNFYPAGYSSVPITFADP